jgi:hypothetical protein
MIRRLSIVLVGLLTSVTFAATSASADPSPVTSDIKAGNDHQTIGSATFTRTADNDGNETLTVDLSTSVGMADDHLCLSDSAYTERVSPGQCPYAHTGLGGATTDQFVVDLGTTYLGKTIYAQLHVATSDGRTAFAGWTDGNPFYGNVAIDAVAEGVPSAPLLGSWLPVGLVALFLGGIGAVAWRRRLS